MKQMPDDQPSSVPSAAVSPSALPCNLRDLGGLPTRGGGQIRPGQVFRSDDLAPAEPTHLRALLGRLQVTTVLDLRSAFELDELGRGGLEGEPTVEVHHLPISLTAASVRGAEHVEELPTTPQQLAGFYADGVEAAAATLARGLSLLARTSEPALFHCVAGKDRTGVLAALLLSAVGVPDELIVEDYARTAANMPILLGTQGLGSGVATPERLERMQTLPAVLWDAPAIAMEGFLAQMRRRYESPLGPLWEAGLSSDDVAALQARLIS